MLVNVVLKDRYLDSIILMLLTSKAQEIPGIERASCMMGTPPNLEILAESGLLGTEGRAATPADLVIALRTDQESARDRAMALIEETLAARSAGSGVDADEYRPRSIAGAMSLLPGANLAFFSVPGFFVRHDALQALRAGLNLMIFSDNVTVETEVELKRIAAERDLLVMGPDCGTAIIGGVGLGFANVVGRGPIGIVGASGTGTQEVSALVGNLGSGISHAIGTGGRDLSQAVGGLTMLGGIDLLESDPQTEVIVLISKPPHPEVEDRVLARAARLKKPCVVNFIGGRPQKARQLGLIGESTLEAAALAALAAAGRPVRVPLAGELIAAARHAWQSLPATRKDLRGLYSGGTLCDETLLLLGPQLAPVASNLKHQAAVPCPDPRVSVGHTCVDLGDDLFTVGRPHPMIDFTLRCERLIAEARDPATAVILLDVVLGYGSHPDPAAVLLPAIARARREAPGQPPAIVAYVLGTAGDPQNRDRQVEALRQAGVLVAATNAQAAALAGMIVTRAEQPLGFDRAGAAGGR